MTRRLRGELTTLRPAHDDDLDLLAGWLADPAVYRYWGGSAVPREEVAADYVGRRSPEVESFVVEADGRPVGYIQYWLGEEGNGGLDMFLVPEARGRGLGPDAARALALHLLDDLGWTRVTVDPALWNERALRAWERAGFEAVEERPPDEEHNAPWLLMAFRR